MMSTDHPTPGVSGQENALEHSRLVRAAASLRAISPQFGWPALLAFLLGPFAPEELSFERELTLKIVGVLLIVGALTLRLAARGYHRRNGFVINGPYRYIRNPVEVGAVWGLCGAGLLLKLPLWYVLLILLLSMAFLSFASLSYEKELLLKLQENYFRYTRRVKRWVPSLLPGVNRVNRDYSFWAAIREEADSLIWFIGWVMVYGIRSHFLVQLKWW
jgi:protein-S-isoprenylcysteine O-methyltransferase Ste14